MKLRAVPALAAGIAGFALGAALLASRPAVAQFTGTPRMIVPPTGQPAAGSGGPAAPQPIEVQTLGPKQFVVATREPRLLQPVGAAGTPSNMLVTVVTHYSVEDGQLVPVEHVRAPAGWAPVPTAGN